MPSSRESLIARAMLDAQLKYDPQMSALRGLLSQRAQEYTRGRRVAASTARGITASIDQTQPQVAAAFDQALGSANAQRSALGVGTEDPQAAAFVRRVGEDKSRALVDLLTQKQQANAGQRYANATARSEYFADKDKIEGQMRGLLGESGAYATQRRGELADEAAKRRQENRRIDISADSLAETQRHNQASEATARETARRAATGKTKVQWAPPEAHAAAKDAIEQAAALVKQRRAQGDGRAEIIALLTRGRAKQAVTLTDADGKPRVDAQGKPIKQTVPAIPKLPADLVRAATNLALDGTLSRGDLKRLHNRGLRIHRLGYELRPPQPKRKGAVGLAVSGRGSAIASRPPVPGLTR